ncbi:hypothetical protein HQ585_09510 [candidate division KSB1 bacterium]|nr:hypothetical protein [candidate division KSB1 bacterium]
MNKHYLDTTLKLYDFTYNNHWNGSALMGPDPGVRWDRVLFRFIKSMLPFVNWKDDRYMLQCQGYWIRNNWILFDLLKDEKYKEIALKTTETILSQQQAEGYWSYALPGWQARVATVEGDYAALGLLASYKWSKDDKYLSAALKWYDFLNTKIGYGDYQGTQCIHYFAGEGGALVPNNATLTLELFGELFEVTRDDKYLEHCSKMVNFLKMVQLESGELPYSIGVDGGSGRTHFMCYQYNAFQLIDLLHYYQATSDENILDVVKKLAMYISTGIHADGHAHYACFKPYPEVVYYTAALGAALLKASQLDVGNYHSFSEKAYKRVMCYRRSDGGFPYSFYNYGFLRDTRSYPRYLSMILRHLLMYIE